MSRKPIVLCFDTETTGKPPDGERYFNEKSGTKAEGWPRVIQLAFILYDTETMKQLAFYDQLIKLKPGDKIPPDSTEVHGITDDDLEKKGISVRVAMKMFIKFFDRADFVVGHNVQFDINVVCAELTLLLRDPETIPTDRQKIRDIIQKLLWDKSKRYCTLQNSRQVCKLPKYVYDLNGVVKDETGHEVIDYTLDFRGNRKIRNPRLETAHQVIFQQKSNGRLHNALVDVAVCLRIFLKLYNDIDICDSENRTKNNFICDTINPSDLKPSDVPRRLGEPAIHPDIIREMNSVNLSRYPSRSRSRSASRTRKVKSLSLKRHSNSRKNKKTRSV
jgi:DNA polymerase III epsilon subunit-like protein